MRLSQNREDEAASLLAESMASWYKPLVVQETIDQAESQSKGKKKTKADIEKIAEEYIVPENQPPFEQRLACARLCMEVNDFSTAAEILTQLGLENDEVIDVHYLMGMCCHFMSEADPAKRADLRPIIQSHFAIAYELHGKLGCPDQIMVEDIISMLERYNVEESEEETLDEDMA